MSFLTRDAAIDLGTANTVVYARGGIVLDEPSVVAQNTRTGEVLAVGAQARDMIGRTPSHIVAIRPLRDGVIAEAEATEQMLRHFVRKLAKGMGSKVRMTICLPSGVTDVELRAITAAGLAAGAGKVNLIQEPMAAALGAGLPVTEATGSLVVDIGGGTTEVAVLSLCGIVASQSLRIGGDELDQAISTWVKREHSLLIGDRTSEAVKVAIGSATQVKGLGKFDVRGRDVLSGLPRTVTLTADEVRAALSDPVRDIVLSVRLALESCPPELAGDIVESGITLTGGGALLHGIDERLAAETGLNVRVADNPLHAVVRGAAACVEDPQLMSRVILAENGAGSMR